MVRNLMLKKCRIQERPDVVMHTVIMTLLLMFVAGRTCGAFSVDPERAVSEQRESSRVEDGETVEASNGRLAVEAEEPQQRPGKSNVISEDDAVDARATREADVDAPEDVEQKFGAVLNALLPKKQAEATLLNRKIDGKKLKQFEARFGRHFDLILRTELHFIRVVCKPSREQYDVIAADGKLARTRAIKRFALIHEGADQGFTQLPDSNTRKPFADDLLISAKRHLTTDQVAAYERELAARDRDHKQMAVQVTAAKIDHKLVLSAEQRKQVTKMLNEDWDVSWGAAQMLMYGGQYFPDIPDSKLTPLLTSSQEKIWRTVNQQGQESWGLNVGMNQAIALPEEKWDGDSGNDAQPASASTERPDREAVDSNGERSGRDAMATEVLDETGERAE